MNSLWI